LPVFTMPSSVSIAEELVITQSGHGCGPRWVGTIDGQVDHRWLSWSVSSPKTSEEVSNAGSLSGLDWSQGWMYVKGMAS
jgi:hypothetical protein